MKRGISFSNQTSITRTSAKSTLITVKKTGHLKHLKWPRLPSSYNTTRAHACTKTLTQYVHSCFSLQLGVLPPREGQSGAAAMERSQPLLRLPQPFKRLQGLLLRHRLRLLGQPADRQVIDNLLDLLHVVLEAVVALPQRVVLQVEQAESWVQLVDEVRYADRPVVISCCHAVDRQPGLEGKTTELSVKFHFSCAFTAGKTLF